MTAMTFIPDDADDLGQGTRAWSLRHGGHVVTTISGEFDVYTAPKWRDHMRSLLEDSPGDLILVVEDVTYFDSTSLGVLVGALKFVRERERCVRIVDRTGDPFTKILRVTGLTKIFPIYASEEAALADAGVAV